jgi:hypothetical protein
MQLTLVYPIEITLRHIADAIRETSYFYRSTTCPIAQVVLPYLEFNACVGKTSIWLEGHVELARLNSEAVKLINIFDNTGYAVPQVVFAERTINVL